MQVQVEKLSPVLMELKIEVPAETVTTEVENAFEQLKKSARVKGFRRGKAPKKVLHQLFGRAVRADVAKRLMDDTLQKALAEKAVQPLTQPAVEPAELKSSQPFSFKARFEVRPDIEKVEWEGLEATRPSVEVSEEALNEEIEKLRLKHATEEPVEDRAAEKGDFANIELSFEIDGEKETESAEKVEVGAGRLLSFLDEAIEGMKVGETKEVEGSFPDNHQLERIRGKSSKFGIELKELKRRVLPEVDDEFAKDCEHEDLAAMKKALTEQIEERLKQRAEEEVAKELVQKLCEKNPIPVPPSLVQQQAQMTQRELMMLAQMTGQSMDDPAMQERLKMDAEVKVRAGLLMAEIAKEKEVKVEEADLEKGYEELAAQSGKNVAKIKAEYRQKQKRDMLIGMILEDKVLDLMEGAAKISPA
ncbi:MAG: trigger factor [Polyangiaceae bacterium]